MFQDWFVYKLRALSWNIFTLVWYTLLSLIQSRARGLSPTSILQIMPLYGMTLLRRKYCKYCWCFCKNHNSFLRCRNSKRHLSFSELLVLIFRWVFQIMGIRSRGKILSGPEILHQARFQPLTEETLLSESWLDILSLFSFFWALPSQKLLLKSVLIHRSRKIA